MWASRGNPGASAKAANRSMHTAAGALGSMGFVVRDRSEAHTLGRSSGIISTRLQQGYKILTQKGAVLQNSLFYFAKGRRVDTRGLGAALGVRMDLVRSPWS